MNVIAADVGGTKTRFVFADTDAPQRIIHEARYECADFDGFDPLLHAFLRDSGLQDKTVDALSLALPGVVEEQRARLTNLPWTLDKQELRKEFGVRDVYFMNDFQASALGIPHMQAGDMIALNQGESHRHETRVVVGAGTGLGVAWLQGDGDDDIRACSSEGGHIDFAPVDETQIELLRFLLVTYEHVSYERLLSGQGLVNLYRFTSGVRENSIEPRQVSAEAEAGNEAAQRALQLFVRIYGAYISNLAVMFKPGGVYITGGIGAKIQRWMQSADFTSAYFNKGRMRPLVERTAVFLVTNERVGVIGAMAEAVKMQQVE